MSSLSEFAIPFPFFLDLLTLAGHVKTFQRSIFSNASPGPPKINKNKNRLQEAGVTFDMPS